MNGFIVSLIVFIFSGSSAHASTVPHAHVVDELQVTPQIIRVRLSDLGHVLSIHGTDLSLSLAKRAELGNVKSDEWLIDCKRNLILEPTSGKSRKIPQTGILIQSASGILSINQRRFREQIAVYPAEFSNTHECIVINHLNLEKYLESVVNSEFNSQWAENAVEAQIIAARTYAVYQMKEMRKKGTKVYDVESTQKDQVFLGLDNTDSVGRKLVEKTRGIILVDHSRPIKAFYHATCGGLTTLPEKVWGNHFAGFTKRVNCPYCAGSPSYQWEYSIGFHEIEKRVWRGIATDAVSRKAFPQSILSNVNQYILMKMKAGREQDSRIQDLILYYAHVAKPEVLIPVHLNTYAVRNWLDATKLKSTLFTTETNGRTMVFKGKGSGHGVGLCQWGAKKMGEKGFTYLQILGHYYPGVKLARIW